MASTDYDKADDTGVVADQTFTHHAEAVFGNRETYVRPGFRGLFSSPYVVACAACSTLGGLVFGYDQGVGMSLRLLSSLLRLCD